MTTLADIRANVAAKLVRSDLTSQIDAQIGAAVRHYRRMPWEFTELRAGVLTTVPSQLFYASVDFTNGVGAQGARTSVPVSDIIEIETIRREDASGYLLERIPYRQFEIWRTSGAAASVYYWTRYGDRIGLYPEPPGVEVLEVSANIKPLIPADESDTSIFFDRCPDMIEDFAAEKVCALYLRNPGKAAEHRANRMEQEAVMNGETRRRTATGSIPAIY